MAFIQLRLILLSGLLLHSLLMFDLIRVGKGKLVTDGLRGQSDTLCFGKTGVIPQQPVDAWVQAKPLPQKQRR